MAYRYEPPFDYFKEFSDVAFRVVADNYVTDDSGTGIVHCAPAFGEDDYRVCLENKVINKVCIKMHVNGMRSPLIHLIPYIKDDSVVDFIVVSDINLCFVIPFVIVTLITCSQILPAEFFSCVLIRYTGLDILQSFWLKVP